MRSATRNILVASLSVLVTACGATQKERALSGGAIGAATGVAVGAVTGMTMVHGALIGGGVGALTGALTNRDQINLGATPTSTSSGNQGVASTGHQSYAPASSPMVEDLQRALGQAGYDPGPADGLSGPRTSGAIMAYQRDNGLTMDGQPSASLLQHLRNRNS